MPLGGGRIGVDRRRFARLWAPVPSLPGACKGTFGSDFATRDCFIKCSLVAALGREANSRDLSVRSSGKRIGPDRPLRSVESNECQSADHWIDAGPRS